MVDIDEFIFAKRVENRIGRRVKVFRDEAGRMYVQLTMREIRSFAFLSGFKAFLYVVIPFLGALGVSSFLMIFGRGF